MKELRVMQRAAKHQVDKNLGRGFKAVGSVLKKKPAWCPLFLWLVPFRVIFRGAAMRYIARYFKELR